MQDAEPTGKARTRPFAGYELISRVSSHRGASTYKALQVALNRTVLVTVLPADAGKLPSHRAHFDRQQAVASRLRHENVISAIDAGTFKGCRYFVTEYVEGHTLADEIKEKGRLGVARAVVVARDVARALAHLESAGLVHRNVSPAAILETETGVVKLVGFALAKDKKPGGAETWIDHDVEDALYLAPEFLRGERGIDARADVYSLGCVLYHMLTGHPPFRSRSAAVILESHATKVPPDPREVVDDLPPGLVEVLDGCLRKRREHRHGRAEDLARDLEAVRTGAVPAKLPDAGALWPGRRPGRRTRLRRR